MMRRIAGSAGLAGLAALGWFAALGTFGAVAARATQVKIFETRGAVSFLGGKLSGVNVDALGRMRLAPRAEHLATLEEPFLFSAAVLRDPAGHGATSAEDSWVVGTGNSGKVLAIDRHGAVRELFAAPEPEVFALWADPDGTVYAGTSPHGKVYRIPPGGKAAPFFDPGETYIWALARDAAGKLLVATGGRGKLYRVDDKGHGEVAFTADDLHIRSLAPQPGGDILLGTAGKGLILRLDAKGHARTLYQGEAPEVAAFATAPDGVTYAALVASEASLVDLSPAAAAAAAGGGGGGGTAPGAGGGLPAAGTGGARPGAKPGKQPAAADAGETPSLGSRHPGATGPRSELLRIAADGSVESLWTFNIDTLFSLLWQNDKLWLATGVEGKLWSYAGGQLTLEEDLDDRQIVTLLPGAAGPVFATTNGSSLYRVVAATEQHGVYTSAALDAGQAARFGTFRWLGEVPDGASVRLSFRSGMSAVPDDTWSPWLTPEARSAPAGSAPATNWPEGKSTARVAGPALTEELPLTDLPRARYVQWRAEITAGGRHGRSPVVYAAELSYRQVNLRPRISMLAALDPGQILVPVSFNPTNQVYEPPHPNRDGIFVPIGTPAGDEGGGGRTKVLWKMGYQTLRWSAADPNDDPLLFDLYFRPAEAADDAPWLKVAGDVDDDHFSFDATALPDGYYRFRLVASDRLANDPDAALSAERISEPVAIDHSPPALVAVEREGKRWRITLRDALSPIRDVEYSVDAGPWKPARAADGLLDAETETVLIDADDAANAKLLLLRATDAAYNVVTFNLSRSR